MDAFSASGPPAAMVCQLSARRGPTTGICEIQAGGGFSPPARKSFSTMGLRSAASSSVLIARTQGTMNVSSTASVMIVTAIERRPPTSRSSRSSTGHVAMTIVVAHINSLRNGRRVHRLPANNVPITSTSSTTRVTSLGA
jgi:hypothetical protein